MDARSGTSSGLRPSVVLTAVLVTAGPACGRHRGEADAAGVTNLTSASLTAPAPSAPLTSARPEPAPLTPAPPPPMVDDSRAIERLVRAECRREMTCDPRGGSQAYEGCSRSLRVALRIELDEATICPYGIAPAALDECLGAIDSETCGPGATTIRRLELCRASALCVPPTNGGIEERPAPP